MLMRVESWLQISLLESKIVGMKKYTDYKEVPFIRKSGINSLMIFFGLFIPLLILVPCYVLITGDVYENNYDKEGNLKKWSSANRYVAIFIVAVQALVLLKFVFGMF